MMKLLSIVIPAYNEEAVLQEAIDSIRDVLNNNAINYELIIVDDGSSDNTWNILSHIARKDEAVTAIKFSRNFGKEAAIFAGINRCKGDCCVVMDSDLQHPPEVVVEMFNIWKNNDDIDIVEAKKRHRGKESLSYKLSAKLFYRLLKFMSKMNLENASDFKLMDRKVIDVLIKIPERQTFFRALSSWVGFNTEEIYFEVSDRKYGETKWSLRSLIKYALNSISSFTSAPLQMVTVIGTTFLVFSTIILIQTFMNKILGHSVEGFTTVIILILLTGGCIMVSLGIIGHYLAKIYEEIKFRPKYIVREVIDNTKRDVYEGDSQIN